MSEVVLYLRSTKWQFIYNLGELLTVYRQFVTDDAIRYLMRRLKELVA